MALVPNLSSYAEQVYQEWVIESAIAPELFFANVTITADEVINHGGEVSYPIHEALNWDIKRWRTSLTGKVQRPEQHGTIIHTLDPTLESKNESKNEDNCRQVFQVKLEHPVLDKPKLKLRKYENPIGSGQIGGFAVVPLSIWQIVSLRHNCPIDGSNFWSWVIRHNLPIIICEGMKKACALISLGYIAIALRGITMGRWNDGNGKLALQPYLQAFATPNRPVNFCFDAETKPKTQQAVYLAQVKTGKLFEAAGCIVNIIQLPLLPDTNKTGVDDFIVAQGADAFHNLHDAAITLGGYQWQWLHQKQLTYSPSLTVNVNDLSSITIDIPKSGIIAIQSAKGTGKTKAIASWVAKSEKLVLLGHRVSLMRSLCQRLGVDYKGDIDRTGGGFITGSGYTLRVGACVDSLLAFNPNNFIGCDLVIDEVEQVLRHLISGATCNKDGKRLALIARLQALVRSARRVIVADADLSDLSLDYLKTLRGDGSEVFLIQNQHQPYGYPVRFICAPSDTAIASEFLTDIAAGKKLFVTTDSKANSKVIVQLLEQMKTVRPNIKVLLINSETSGGDIESEFIRNINKQVKNYDVVIATPSMSTGVSIEKKWFDKVYGIFYGTLTDADISQSLARVRNNIPRVVWCAEQGNNFSRIDRSEFPAQIKNTLKNRWDREASLIRASLGAELTIAVNDVTWDNPHIDLWAKVEAANNTSMWSLRTNLIERLKSEGHRVEVINCDQNDNQNSNLAKEVLKEAKQQVKEEQYQAIASAQILSKSEIQHLAQKESRTPTELLNETKTAIALFYATDQITPELVEYDRNGKRRSEILKFEALLHEEIAITSDINAIAKQAKFNRGIFIPDQPCLLLGRLIRDKLGLINFLVPNVEYTDTDLATIGDICRQCATDIKKYLGFNIPKNATNIWIFRALCAQLGIKIKSKRLRDGDASRRMTNYCWLDPEAWDELQTIVKRREQHRQEFRAETAIAPIVINNIQEGAIAKPSETTELEQIINKVVDQQNQEQASEPILADVETLTQNTSFHALEQLRSIWHYLSDSIKITIKLWWYRTCPSGFKLKLYNEWNQWLEITLSEEDIGC